MDCFAHHKNLPSEIKKSINCSLCIPNDKQLFHNEIEKDLITPNPCKKSSEKEIKAKEIIIKDTGEKFYYSIYNKNDPIPQIFIYKYSENIDGYVEMKRDNPLYSMIVKKILDM